MEKLQYSLTGNNETSFIVSKFGLPEEAVGLKIRKLFIEETVSSLKSVDQAQISTAQNPDVDFVEVFRVQGLKGLIYLRNACSNLTDAQLTTSKIAEIQMLYMGITTDLQKKLVSAMQNRTTYLSGTKSVIKELGFSDKKILKSLNVIQESVWA